MKKKSSPPAFIQMGKFKLKPMQALIPGIVLILVGLILAVKAYQNTAAVADDPPFQLSATLPAVPADAGPEAAAQTGHSSEQIDPTAGMPPEAQLDYLIAAGQPTFAFFHSNDCIQCIKMIEVVDEVYPDFAGSVALVDVNVYDDENQNLLRRAGIRAIPTMFFIDSAGNGQGFMGVMETGAFRQQLQQLVEE